MRKSAGARLAQPAAEAEKSSRPHCRYWGGFSGCGSFWRDKLLRFCLLQFAFYSCFFHQKCDKAQGNAAGSREGAVFVYLEGSL